MTQISWPLIDELASELGAKERARLKWRQRGVPAEWQIKIVRLAEARHLGPVTFDHFESLPRSQPRSAA